ncbi:MAG: hypothetical protein H7325_08930 [Pedobacter sp.]|nr:hypothetical protein [Pedobacter sp.]
MKYILSFFCFAFILQLPLHAQSKKKAEKGFVQQLNTLIKKSSRQSSGYNGIMTIDSAFAINKQGMLSVTVRYRSDTSFIRVRTTAPVNKINTLRYDLYMILEYKDNLVTFYESAPGSNVLVETGKGGWFHVGAPMPENYMYKEKLQAALDKVLIVTGIKNER